MRILIVFLLCAATIASAEPKNENPEKSDKLEVPSAAELAKAEITIKDLFKAEYASKKKADTIDLARKLLQNAKESKNDPSAQYVLLREARDVAARAGDVDTANIAIEEITNVFALPPRKAKLELLEQLEKAPPTLAVTTAIIESALSVADEAIQEDDYLLAAKVTNIAQSAANKTKSATYLATVTARSKDIERLKAAHDKIRTDLDTLKTNPDDASANNHVGRFYCLEKGDWKRGLPMLAKGDDEKLKSLALKELQNPEKAAERAALAEAWWEFAQSLDKPLQVQTMLHAADLYRDAIGELTVLDKIRAEKRITEAEKLIGGASSWLIIFRSNDASIWDKDIKKSLNHQAMKLDRVPKNVRYLNLTECAKNNYVIIQMTKDRLGKMSDENGFGWSGTGKVDFNTYHLGIYDQSKNLTESENRGDITLGWGNNFNWAGWGFGHRAWVEGGTVFGWASKEVPKAICEIAVKTSALTLEETKHLLKKK